MKSSRYGLWTISHLWVDDIQCWASTVKRWSNSPGKGLICGDGSGSSTGRWWIRFLDVCSKIDDSVCMHSMDLRMMSSFPHFLFADPLCGRRQFRLSRASLMRHWRRRSRPIRLRADSSERIWCGTYFLRRLGLWTLCRSSVDWKISTEEAQMYTILVSVEYRERDLYQCRRRLTMWISRLSSLYIHWLSRSEYFTRNV